MNCDIAIIGLGRVGLPLFLFLESRGFRLLGIERNENIISQLRKKKMPFKEKGCDKLLKKTRGVFSNNFKEIKSKKCKYIIITVGTPLQDAIETDLSYINEVLKELLNVIQKDQTIILRSTVGPETTQYVKNKIEQKTRFKVGKNIFLAFCPERLAENKALKELSILPQIIGTEDDMSYKKTIKIFKKLNIKTHKTNFLSAELVKLFNNNYRYIEFAMANQFAIIANNLNQNIYEIIKMCNDNYPRGKIFKPGLTGGSCLRKDFGMLNERTVSSDIFLTAFKINEYVPYHLTYTISQKIDLKNKKIAVLGYTFKKDSDNERESLVPKLIRQIEKKVPKKITICEPNIQSSKICGYDNKTLKNTLKDADVLFIAINHSKFKKNIIFKYLKKKAWIVDIWNHLQLNKQIIKT